MAEICTRCKNVNDRPNRGICTACNDKQKKQRLEKEEHRRKHGLCVRCGCPINDSPYMTCYVCLTKQNFRRKKNGAPSKRKKKASKLTSAELMEYGVITRKPQTPAERERQRQEKAEILRECKNMGISYGQYVAREYLKNMKS